MKKFNWQGLAIAVLVVILAAVSIFVINSEKKEISSKEPEKVYVGKEKGEPLKNFSKDEAVNSLKLTLESVSKDVDGKKRTTQERLEALDKENTDMKDVLNKETIDSLYLADEFKSSKFNRRFVASALLTYYQLAIQSNEDKKIQLVADSSAYDEMVYLDNKLQVANIPFDLFIGNNRGIFFEMDYIDGKWKLNPYSSMMSLITIIKYENQSDSKSKK